MSWRGRCESCATPRIVDNQRDLRDHSGAWFHHWRKQMAASCGAVLLDDLDDTDPGV